LSLHVSIPSNGSIQFLQEEMEERIEKLEKWVSIPSNGSIQFLPCFLWRARPDTGESLNPLKRVNSILTRVIFCGRGYSPYKSQSPQTGQFNSYADSCICPHTRQKSQGLNPLKRVNSILTELTELRKTQVKSQCLNPLKRVNSILTKT